MNLGIHVRVGGRQWVALLSFVVLMSLTGASGKQPNVLFIVVDDLRPELNCYGVDEVVSPNFDRLARMGMLCERAYVQYPVCNPSRSSFLSGLRPEQTGILSNETPFREKLGDKVSLPELFRLNGYRTGGFGKIFHKGQDESGKPALFKDPRSWDEFYDGLRDVPRKARSGEGRNLTGGKLPWCEWRAAEGDDEELADGLNTTRALGFLAKESP
ncbi:MAG: sulfatase-like hydrolase/transferase, partial [Haloferula sp.]